MSAHPHRKAEHLAQVCTVVRMTRVLVDRALLERLEWCGKTRNIGRPKCVVCKVTRAHEWTQHAPDCALAAALAQPDHECATRTDGPFTGFACRHCGHGHLLHAVDDEERRECKVYGCNCRQYVCEAKL